MRHLLLDFGNTSAKMAYYQDGKLGEVMRCSHLEEEDLALQLLQEAPVDVVVLSSVRDVDVSWESKLQSCCRKLVRFQINTPGCLPHNYATPNTLGMDRMAAAVGARALFPNQDLLIFDFGTAITIDRVSKEGIFEGGNIALGLDSRFRALHEYTGKLPRLEKPAAVGLLGNSTQTAMENGVVLGTIFEIEGYLRSFPDHLPIFTGGDAFYFAEKLKTPIFAVYNLVLTGLARIAEENAI